MSYLEVFLNNQAYSTHENWQQFRAWLIQEVQDHYEDFQGCNIMAFLPKDPAGKPCITGGINFKTEAEYTDYFMDLLSHNWFCAVIHEKDKIIVGFNTATFGEEVWIIKTSDGFSITVDHYRDRTRKADAEEEINWPEVFKAIADALIEKINNAS